MVRQIETLPDDAPSGLIVAEFAHASVFETAQTLERVLDTLVGSG